MTIRGDILRKGVELTEGDRNVSYGHPHPNLTSFAHLVNVYLKSLGWDGRKLDSTDGAIIMTLAKISRVAVNKNHEDNYIDGATYMAIAAECAQINADIGVVVESGDVIQVEPRTQGVSVAFE